MWSVIILNQALRISLCQAIHQSNYMITLQISKVWGGVALTILLFLLPIAPAGIPEQWPVQWCKEIAMKIWEYCKWNSSYPISCLYSFINKIRERLSGNEATWPLGDTQVPVLKNNFSLTYDHSRSPMALRAFKYVVLHILEKKNKPGC